MDEIAWDLEEGLALVVYYGDVGAEELRVSTEAVLRHPAWRRGTAIIREFSRSRSLLLLPGELDAFVAYKAADPALRHTPDGWVAWRDTQRAIGALHQALAERAGLPACLHRTVDEILRELGRAALPPALAALHERANP